MQQFRLRALSLQHALAKLRLQLLNAQVSALQLIFEAADGVLLVLQGVPKLVLRQRLILKIVTKLLQRGLQSLLLALGGEGVLF